MQIEIEVDSQPPIFEVEEKLAALTGLKQAPRSAILHSLFSYIKSHDLQVVILPYLANSIADFSQI